MKKKLIISCMLLSSILMFATACSPKLAQIPSEEMSALTDNKFEKILGETRIMSANVLVDIKGWGGEPTPDRANRMALATKHYKPDVIGAQEFCASWYSKFMPMVKDDGYQVIKEKYSLFTENRSPIIFNTKTLNLLEHGIKKYSQGDNNGCRVASWAVFERKDDKKVFAVVSTHLDLIRKGKEDAELAIMMSQVEELNEQVKAIVDKNSCPVVITGDFNCMEERAEYLVSDYHGAVSVVDSANSVYKKLCESYTDAKYVKGLKKHDIGGGLLPNGAWDSPVWDHIFFTGKAKPQSFATLSSVFFQRNEDTDTNRLSDHLLIFSDFLFE
ncbi:MAG: endonuclease/exonuclease/phosphatase family protein [Clostridia bacterium]